MPFCVNHGDIDALGFRVGDVAYLPDVSDIPEAAWPLLDGLDCWVLDALRRTPHPTHAHLDRSLAWIARAMSSLPVPLSPCTNTERSLPATRSARRVAGLLLPWAAATRRAISAKRVAPAVAVIVLLDQGASPSAADTSGTASEKSLGAADAPVVVVEYGDFQCPYCKRFVETSFPGLKRDYVDTGKVRWVTRDLPLGFHANAHKAAQAAHCAGEQGRYWEMRDTLFRNNLNLAPEQLARYSAPAGIARSAAMRAAFSTASGRSG